jgi:hypothetical protein
MLELLIIVHIGQKRRHPALARIPLVNAKWPHSVIQTFS